MTRSEPIARTRLVDVLVRFRLVLLVLGLILIAVSWPVARQLQFDRSIESLFAGDDPHLADYRESKALFGGDEFAIVAYRDPELMDSQSVQISKPADDRITALSERLNGIPGVNPASTQDLAKLTRRTDDVMDQKAAAQKSFLRRLMFSKGKPFARRRVYAQVRGVLLGDDSETTALAAGVGGGAALVLLGDDGETTAVALRLKPESESPESRGETIAKIRKVAAEFEKEHEFETYVVGEPVQVHDMFQYVEEDGSTLFFWSLVALSIVILTLFRSLRWVVLPLMVVVASIVWTEALLVLSGTKLSMVSSMMNSLVTIIGIATVTHVTVHYRHERREHDRVEAFRRTLFALLPAVFWTCATTAVGFAALISSEIAPVRSFGLMLASATLMVFLAVAVLLPGGVLLGRFDADPKTAPAEDRLGDVLSLSATAVQRRPWVVAGIMLAIFAVAGVGLTRLTVQTDFSKNFRDSSPIVQSLEFVETELGGAGTWEVNFPAPKKLDKEYLAKVRRLAEKLRREFVRNGEGEVTKVIAVTDAVDAISKGLVPDLDERLEMVQQVQPELIESLYQPEHNRMRIVLRAREQQQSATKLELIDRVEASAQEWADAELKDDDSEPEVKATGLYVLLAFLIDNLLKDQLVSFALAAAGIVVMMSIAFRSIRLGLLLLLPNTFPIVLVIGGIGWIGLPINIATAMIASVSMGLTIDFNVHYLAGYRRARARGLSPAESLQSTLRTVGRALVFSNIALIVGFSVLTLSHFIPLIYFGILVSFAMFGGLIGDLLLMPLILRWVAWPSESMLKKRQTEPEPQTKNLVHQK